MENKNAGRQPGQFPKGPHSKPREVKMIPGSSRRLLKSLLLPDLQIREQLALRDKHQMAEHSATTVLVAGSAFFPCQGQRPNFF